jgi:hypothetical protein
MYPASAEMVVMVQLVAEAAESTAFNATAVDEAAIGRISVAGCFANAAGQSEINQNPTTNIIITFVHMIHLFCQELSSKTRHGFSSHLNCQFPAVEKHSVAS